MSLFNWFSKKTPVPPPADADSSGLAHVDATVPFNHSGGNKVEMPGSAANRKSERLERREMLYTIVRESMTRLGVLSSSYKFKVLSLDSRGRQYLVMMDLVRLQPSEISRLAEIEGLIAKSAKLRHDIVVTSVYWRVNDPVSTASMHAFAAPAAAPVAAAFADTAVQAAPAAPAAKAAASAEGPKTRFEPLIEDEVAAFKQALASLPMPKKLSAPGEIVQSGRRNPAPEIQFADTELDERMAPLSGTQYGDL